MQIIHFPATVPCLCIRVAHVQKVNNELTYEALVELVFDLRIATFCTWML